MLKELLCSEMNVTRAFDSAINECFGSGHTCFPGEIRQAKANRKQFIKQVQKQLSHLEQYQPQYGFYYTMPKTDLVDRQLVHLPLQELVMFHCFLQVIGDRLDSQLQENCFANRIERDLSLNILGEDFAQKAWPNYCAWQQDQGEKHSLMIKTDLSSFFDNVNIDILINKLAVKTSTSKSSPFFEYFRKLLTNPAHHYAISKPQVNSLYFRVQGLITGPKCMGVLANYYLMDIDNLMSQFPDVEYGRYVDDIKLFSNDKAALIESYKQLQNSLYQLGLSINNSKTKLINNNEEVLSVLKEELISVNHYGAEETTERTIATHTQEAMEMDIDESFEDRDNSYDLDNGINSVSDAKKYCFYLSNLDLKEWDVKHLTHLALIFKCYPSSLKHACWLMVLAWTKGTGKIQDIAFKFISKDLWLDDSIHQYGKSRILHHLVKERRNGFSYLQSNQAELKETNFVDALVDIMVSQRQDITLLRCYAIEAYSQMKPDVSQPDILKAFRTENTQLNSSESHVLELVFSNDEVFEL
ncbi:RNA-directed DNA polymerase [Vibrio rarus]